MERLTLSAMMLGVCVWRAGGWAGGREGGGGGGEGGRGEGGRGGGGRGEGGRGEGGREGGGREGGGGGGGGGDPRLTTVSPPSNKSSVCEWPKQTLDELAVHSMRPEVPASSCEVA